MQKGQKKSKTTKSGTHSEETAALVYRLLDESQAAGADKKQTIRDNWDFVVNRKQWPKERPSYRHSEVLNFTFSVIQSVIPIMTDNRPEISYMPPEPSDRPFTEMLSRLVHIIWRNESWDEQMNDWLFDDLCGGTGLLLVGWNPELKFGLGDIELRVLDPDRCYPDPNSTYIQDGRFFIYTEPVPKEKAKGMQAESHVSTEAGGRTGDLPYDQHDPNRSGSRPKDEVMLIHCWIKSDEITEEKKDGEYVKKKKYPNGRYIQLLGGKVIKDGKNEFNDGMFPVVKLVDHNVPRSFWGIGEVDNLKPAQRMLNKVTSWILDSLDAMGKPQWVIDTNSGVDPEYLTNEPDLVIEKNQGTEVRKEAGQGVPASMFNIFNILKISFDQINGLGELSQGQRPAGVTSGAAIESLQEAAQTRIRQKARNYETALGQLSQLVASRIMQFYGAPRVFRYLDENNVPQFFDFHIKDAILHYRPYQVKNDEYIKGGIEKMPISTELSRRGFPDILADVGSALPYAKHMKAETAFRLYQGQIIDGKEVLKTIQWPNWEKVWAEQEAKIKAQEEEIKKQEMLQGGQNG